MGNLVTLAQESLKPKVGDLTEGEIKLLNCIEDGIYADFQEKNDQIDNPLNAGNWKPTRIVRSEIINWLCKDRNTIEYIPIFGIRVIGANIIGRLDLSFTAMDYPVLFVYCYIPSGVDIYDAKIKFLEFDGSYISHCSDPAAAAIFGDNLSIESNLFIRNGVNIEGATRLLYANIGGQISCAGSKFINSSSEAFNADQIIVRGSVILNNGAIFQGLTTMRGAHIGGELDCSGSSFSKANISRPELRDVALACDGVKIGDKLSLNKKATFYGEVRIPDSEIGGQLNCSESVFNNPNSIAFNADRCRIKSSAFLSDRASFAGSVRFCQAEIESQLCFNHSSFDSPEDRTLNLQGISVRGALFFDNISSINGSIDLTDAKINTLREDGIYWDKIAKLAVKGFKYSRIECPADFFKAENWLKWPALQYSQNFWPGTYIQLAKVFRESGLENSARRILIEKNRIERKYIKNELNAISILLHPLKKSKMLGSFIWNWLFDKSANYGYSLIRLLWWSFLLIIIGTVVGYINFELGNMYFTGASLNPAKIMYLSVCYSVDSLLPIVDLAQEKFWIPVWDSCSTLSQITYVYFKLHILAGWILITMLIAGITNLMRRE